MIEFISKMFQNRKAARKFRPKRGLFVVLVGLDGSGKTTVARKLCGLVAGEGRFDSVHYFHWLPRLSKHAEFSFPDLNPVPRKRKLEANIWRSSISIIRLLKNILLTNLAYWSRLHWRLRRNALILMDRYYYNYYLDPASVKYYGPGWLLEWARRLFPKPDLVVVLKTRPQILLSRKQELSEEEVLRQIQVLDRLQFRAGHTIEVDASLSPGEVARKVMEKILEVADE